MQTGNAVGAQLQPARPPRHLERIASEADRAHRLSYLVQDFLDRFYGAGPEAAASGAAGEGPIQVSYRSEMDRLSANLDVLEARVNSLTDIG